MTKKERRNKVVIRDYVVDRKSPQEISRIRQISLTTVYYILRQANIKLTKIKKGRKPRAINKPETWNTSYLEFLYQEIDMSASELAWWFHVSKRYMEKILQKRGIKKSKCSD